MASCGERAVGKVSENVMPVKPWTIESFKENFEITVAKMDNLEIEFDLIGINAQLVNVFRRVILTDVPTMAIEKVHVATNTSIMNDEVLAHRLGLIPLQADAREFQFKLNPNSDGNENDSLEFELKIKCKYNKDANKESSCAEDLYKNSNVYSKHIKWLPKGNQKDKFSESTVGPTEGDILINKLRPGHELDLKLVAVKGTGADHMKFCPATIAFYRGMPKITLNRPIEGEEAENLQDSLCTGVISIREENNRKRAVVNNERYAIGCKNLLRHEGLNTAIDYSVSTNHYIFSIESVGAMKPDVIFREALTLLRDKCLNYLKEMK